MANGKRPVQINSDDDEEPGQDGFYDARQILKETMDKYLIDWEGKDEHGDPWKPSWELKEDCTSALIQDWEARKRREKKKKQRAKSNETSSSRQQSVNSSEYDERKGSRDGINRRAGDVVKPAPMTVQYHPRELNKKRRRTPEPQAQPKQKFSGVMNISDSEEETNQAAVDKHINHKRRRLDRESPEIEFQHSTTTKNVANSKPVAHRSSESSMSGPELPLAGPKPLSKPQSNLQAITQLSPTMFRENLEPPLSSQIEEFSTPESPQQRPKPKAPQIAHHSSHKNSSHKKGEGEARPVSQREPLHSRLDRAKQQAPERLKDLGRMERSRVLPQKEPLMKEPPQPLPKSPPKSSANMGADSERLEESIVPSSLPEDMYTYGEMVERDKAMEQAPPEPPAKPAQRPSTPPLSPNHPIKPSPKQPADDAELKLAAKDAMIVALEARIEMMQEDRDRLEQRLENNTRDYSLTKRNMEQQITSLTTALKQFGSIVGPAGIDAILKSSTAPNPPTAVASSTTVDVLMEGPATNVHVRSEDDEQLINKLREENAKLQDAVLQLRAEKNGSEAMLNQVRDVALRAEAAKTDLNRQVRILTETARNAPKIAEDVYQSQLTTAEEEVDKLKTQIEILMEQSRRSGDNLRKKASKGETLSSKYRSLKTKYKRLSEETSELQNDQEAMLLELDVARTMIERLGGVAPTREELHQLIFTMQNDGSESGAGSLPMFFDEHDRGITEDEEESRESLQSDPPEDTDPVLVVEEIMSGPESVFDPPNLVIEDDLVVDEESQIQANQSTQSTTETNFKPLGTENSEELVWLCFWHTTEDSCTDRFTSKGDLVAHVLGNHIRL